MNLPSNKFHAFRTTGWIVALILYAGSADSLAAQSAPPAPQSATATPAPVTNAASQKDEVELRERSEIAKQSAMEDAAFAKTKAGKICKKNPGWSRQTCEDVAAHNVRIGMTREQARQAWATGWLKRGPDRINQTVTATGVYEQWVYSALGPTPYSRVYQYLYFTNGVLTSYQLAR